jgi:hypothetical protein
MRAFPGYQAAYFRRSVRFSKEKISSSFHFYETPVNQPPGYISLFELALTLQTQERNPDRDFFEVCYDSFLTSRNSAEQLKYLHQFESEEIREDEYRRQFRMAIIHIARTLLLPKAAYDEAGQNWKQRCNLDQIRNEFALAVTASKNSGEVGKAMTTELEKVRRRIDQNNDGHFSDKELEQFLSERLQIVRYE